MKAIVFIIVQIFFATRAVLKIGEYPRIFPSFSWGIFGHVTRLDQSCAKKCCVQKSALTFGARATTTQLYPGRDTFEFDQKHVTKNPPNTVLVLLSESLGI